MPAVPRFVLVTALGGCLLLSGSYAAAQSSHHTISITRNTTSDTLLKPLLGVISGPLPVYHSPAPDLTPQLQDIGVTSIRNNHYLDDRLDIERIFRCPDTTTYPSWECDPYDESNYHWDGSDELFQSIVDGGFEPFLRLGGEVQSEPFPHDFRGPQNATQEDNWIVAAIKMAQRYSHWHGQNPVTYLDIWTEWPNREFWDRSSAEFIRFWVKAFDQIKSAFPDLKVGGPGFLGCTVGVMNGQIEGNVAINFLNALYQRRLKPDWIGWHLWHNDPEKFYQAAHQYRDLLNGVGDFASVPWAGTGFFDGVELICDAYGISQYDDSSGEPVPLPLERQVWLHTHAEGAAILTGQWIALQLSDVERAYYYHAGDERSNPNASWDSSERGWSGLFYGDSRGTYKPHAHAFRLWSRMVNEFPRLLSTDFPSVSSTAERLWVLAGSAGRKLGVLISNTESDEQTYTLTVFGQAVTPARFDISLYQVDDEQDGRTAVNWTDQEFRIPAGTVQLVVLQPKGTAVEDRGQRAATGASSFLVSSPNPFNSSTVIRFCLAHRGHVRVEIFDLTGRKVKTLVDRMLNGSEQSVRWRGEDSAGRPLPSGIYVCRVSLDGHPVLSRKLLYLK